MSNRELYPDAFKYFEKHAQYLGGKNYYICFDGVEIFAKDPAELFMKFKDIFYQVAQV